MVLKYEKQKQLFPTCTIKNGSYGKFYVMCVFHNILTY